MAADKKSAPKEPGMVRKQHYPIFAVKSMGTMIEFSDKRSEADSAYRTASDQEKIMYKIDSTGRTTCLQQSRKVA